MNCAFLRGVDGEDGDGVEWKASYICILLLVLGRCCEAELVIYTAAWVEEPATKNGGARKEGFDTGARAATLLKSWIGDEE